MGSDASPVIEISFPSLSRHSQKLPIHHRESSVLCLVVITVLCLEYNDHGMYVQGALCIISEMFARFDACFFLSLAAFNRWQSRSIPNRSGELANCNTQRGKERERERERDRDFLLFIHRGISIVILISINRRFLSLVPSPSRSSGKIPFHDFSLQSTTSRAVRCTLNTGSIRYGMSRNVKSATIEIVRHFGGWSDDSVLRCILLHAF